MSLVWQFFSSFYPPMYWRWFWSFLGWSSNFFKSPAFMIYCRTKCNINDKMGIDLRRFFAICWSFDMLYWLRAFCNFRHCLIPRNWYSACSQRIKGESPPLLSNPHADFSVTLSYCLFYRWEINDTWLRTVSFLLQLRQQLPPAATPGYFRHLQS